jgi:hypothetical protein
MALKHLDTTLRKSADLGETLFSSVQCHINTPLSVKIMQMKVNLILVYVISMFLLFMEPRFSRILLNIRALKGAGESERNSVFSELQRTAVSRYVRLYRRLTSRLAGWLGG